MATVNVIVLKHQKKKDGTWNVRIRVTHKTKSVYINTAHFITKDQLKKDFTLKDYFIIDLVNPVLAEYRKRISALGPALDLMSAKELAEHLQQSEHEPVISFKSFCKEHLQYLKDAGKLKSAQNYNTVVNSLSDFFKGKDFLITDITSNSLVKFENYLKGPRIVTRLNQFGRPVTITSPGLTSGIFNYMRDLRTLFNAARNKYNDAEVGIIRIKHYPFQLYKVANTHLPVKRNLPIETIIKIRDYKAEGGGREELARDLFMLSFYLCGMNSVDLYGLSDIKSDRIEYYRSKTKGKRKDNAFISILIPEMAKPIIEKQIAGKGVTRISLRYSSIDNLNKALNLGLKVIGEKIGVPNLTFYHARHSFGNLARNTCRCSKDDVALAMNHVDQSLKITDLYIEKNWSIIDEVQGKVLALLFDEP
jgi:integrase